MNKISAFSLCVAVTFAVLSASSAEAGRTRGPGYKHSRVQAGGTIYFDDTYRADSLAEVIVDGDGDTDLDVFVYDENGILVDSDTDYSDYCVVRWNPRWTGGFRIVVKNHGSVYNDFTITSN